MIFLEILLIFFERVIVRDGGVSTVFSGLTTSETFIDGGVSTVFSSKSKRLILRDGGVSTSLGVFSVERFIIRLGGVSDAKAVPEEIKTTKDRATRKIFDLNIAIN